MIMLNFYRMAKMRKYVYFILGFLTFQLSLLAHAESTFKIIKQELIFPLGLIKESHASTIAEMSNGTILVSWFGGTKEGDDDVKIWQSSMTESGWSKPRVVAYGSKDGKPLPTWNPVLFNIHNKTYLFYKVGKTPSTWEGKYITSTNNGLSWSKTQALPNGIYGPIKNKPILSGKNVLFPSSEENDKGWFVHIEKTSNMKNFNKIEVSKPTGTSAIQPTLLKFRDNEIKMYTRSDQGVLMESQSSDSGHSWTTLRKSMIPSTNSGVDGIVLRDGTGLIVHNPGKDRSILSISRSNDNGKTWGNVLTLESQEGKEFSYPAIIQSSNGKIHITYTYNRESIKHITLEENNK